MEERPFVKYRQRLARAYTESDIEDNLLEAAGNVGVGPEEIQSLREVAWARTKLIRLVQNLSEMEETETAREISIKNIINWYHRGFTCGLAAAKHQLEAQLPNIPKNARGAFITACTAALTPS